MPNDSTARSACPAGGRRPIVRAALALAALVAAATPAPRAHGGGAAPCDLAREPLAIVPGAEQVACDRAWRLLLARDLPASDGSGVLRIDLLARPLDPATGAGRNGGYVPGLRPRYRLLRADTPLAEGVLTLRLSAAGPSYGADVALPGDVDDDEPLALWIEPGLLAPFTAGALDAPSAPAAPEAVGPSLRIEQVGTLSPRAPDDYNDIWGWNDGVTFLAILGGENGTSFIDVTDPSDPVEIAYIGGPNSSWRDIKTWGDYAYIVTEGVGAGEGMQIVDLTDPLSPTLVTTWTETFVTAHNIWIDEPAGLLWAVGTDNGVRILDIAGDPTQPVEIGSWTERYVHDAFVGDGRAFFSEINNGLHEILDASDPADLQVLASWPTPGGAAHNSFPNRDQSLTVTTDEVTGGVARVWDTSDLSGAIPELGAYDPDPATIVHNVLVDDEDDAVVAISHYGIGVHLMDMHRPSAPLQLGFFDTYGSGDTGFVGCWGVYPYDPRGLVYGSDISGGLFVLRYVPTGGNVSGIVRDAASGDPVAGARIVVLADGAETRSGSDGAYAIYAPEGPVVLRVTAPGWSSRIVRAGSIAAGGRLDADVSLMPLPRATLAGTVRSAADGSPVAGATVRLVALGRETVTDADGAFRFDGTPVGARIVSAHAFGHADGETAVLLGAAGASGVEMTLDAAAFADDAEADAGWTLGVPGDGATSGVWTRVDPNGTSNGTVQPEDDHTPAPGVVAFITGQQAPGQASEANDVDGGETTLVSPALPAAGLGAAQVRYHRWVAVRGGLLSGGGSLAAEISGDDGATWTPLEQVADHENAWTPAAFDVGSRVPLSDAVRVRFVATPNSPYNFRVLECGVDDVDLVPACLARFNPAQPDADGDGRVDPCDGCPADPLDDGDGDGLCGDADNAPLVANPDQADGDADGVGDAADLCPGTADPAQRDLDGDGTGDACDGDLDGDGVADAVDPDRDDDGIADGDDACPTVPDTLQRDDDLDGVGDACDTDDGLVAGLRLTGHRLSWEPEDGVTSWNIYRGDLGAPELLPLARCVRTGLTTRWSVDSALPVPGDGFFYLVTLSDGAGEGGLGSRSDGTPRAVDTPCQ